MYKVTGYFRNNKVSKVFTDLYEAIDYKDVIDAHYPLKVTFEKGVSPMRSFIVNSWNVVMDHEKNPLSHIPDFSTRHMVMQVLAWMWVSVFTIASGTWAYAGANVVVHTVLITGIVLTVATFETAKRKPNVLTKLQGLRGRGGEHE